jgi:hypothetical protein
MRERIGAVAFEEELGDGDGVKIGLRVILVPDGKPIWVVLRSYALL